MSSIFGKLFSVATFGESHGVAVGAVIDGCPAGLPIRAEEIQDALDRRRPGQNALVTPRKELDRILILSGVFEGKTTGTPIALMAMNENQHSGDYSEMMNWYRPGHADLTYDLKYGFRDYRGGGRASARETLARVSAGVIAGKILKLACGTDILSWVESIGHESASIDASKVTLEMIEASPVRCPDPVASVKMAEVVKTAIADNDSVGAVLALDIRRPPVGVGEPVFDKLQAVLGSALLSIPACKGFEIGRGFEAAKMRGSAHNDIIRFESGEYHTVTNNAGGSLGGITDGETIHCRLAFKPTATIAKEQKTAGKDHENGTLSARGRHDPCVALRAPVIVESMAALALVNLFLEQRARANLF
ncbi:MAG: chorismate synthase [Fibrobacteraceae bacterium]|nr:chorismate synthase [Fibrobacteraceae bacterium]